MSLGGTISLVNQVAGTIARFFANLVIAVATATGNAAVSAGMLRQSVNIGSANGQGTATDTIVRQRLMAGDADAAAVSVALPDRARDMFALSSGIAGVVTAASRDRVMVGTATGAAAASETFDPDVVTWWAAIGAANVNLLTVAAVDNLVVGLKAAGLWASVYMLDLCCGNGLTQALVQFKSPAGIGATSYVNHGFVSGDFIERGSNGGIQSNGSKYLDSAVNPVAQGWNPTSFGLWVYARTHEADVSSGIMFGNESSTTPTNRTSLSGSASGNDSGRIAATTASGAGGSDGPLTGLLGICTDGSAAYQYYHNGAAVGSPVTGDGAFANCNFGKYTCLIASGGTSSNANRLCSSVILTAGLSSAQAATLYSLMQAFETALGRNV